MRSKHQQHGFTLVELMISVAIVGILSATAVALFRDQQFRAKRTEAMTNLEAIAKMERSYFGEFGVYPFVTPPGGAPPIGPAARQWALVAGNSFDVIGFAAEGAAYFDYDVATPSGLCATCGTAECFTISAYSDLEGDGFPAVLTYAHPDSLGTTCNTQALNLPPPIDFQTGLPVLNAPARQLVADDY